MKFSARTFKANNLTGYIRRSQRVTHPLEKIPNALAVEKNAEKEDYRPRRSFSLASDSSLSEIRSRFDSLELIGIYFRRGRA